VYWHSEEPALSSWWRTDGSCALSLHFYQTTVATFQETVALSDYWVENLYWHYYCCLTNKVTVPCEIYRYVCSALATSINWYGSAKADICVGPFHTVHYFLLLVCLLQWSTDFTRESAAKTSIRIMLHFCDIHLPFNSSIIHSVEHKLACCQHFKYCTYCKERLVFFVKFSIKICGFIF
jgi:hypothetical protein